MRLLSRTHPSLDVLSDFRRSTQTGTTTSAHTDVAAHVASCAVCRASLASLEQIEQQVATLPVVEASAALRERMLASRASGSRVILPLTDSTELEEGTNAHGGVRWRAWATAAAALAVALFGLRLDGPSTIEAAATSGTMSLSTETPRVGERVTVRYRAGATLARQRTLTLRARIRTNAESEYTTGVPVVALTTLQKQQDGTFSGNFVLADSLVYAALVVEDPSAMEIDDRGGRTWTVLRAGPDGQPSLDALSQLVNDLFGRNWEAIFSTTSRMVTRYPDSLASWRWQKGAHSWMGLGADSIRALHHDHVVRFDRILRAQERPSPNDVAVLANYARDVDSSVADYWRARMLIEAPSHDITIAARRSAALRVLWDRVDTTAALREIETAWGQAGRYARHDILSYFAEVAFASGDTSLMRRWADRQLSVGVGGSSRGSESSLRRWVALEFAGVPALRAEGLQRLRAELDRLTAATRATEAGGVLNTNAPAIDGRMLDESITEYRARLDADTRATLAALGRALVLAGQHRAALDTLALAAASGWSVPVMRDIRAASLAAGDTAIALTMSARLAVDPRISASRADSLATFAIALQGRQRWEASLAAQRKEFVKRVLATGITRSIGGAVNIRGADGVARDLRQLANGQVTIVAFWSRFCGPAIASLPALHQVAARLDKQKVRTFMVIEESTWSPELKSFLSSNNVTLPAYLDHEKEASGAFNQWSTPNFYVLDAEGRILFEPTGDPDLLLVRAEAARLASGAR
ncbi:MAG: redoxin domain-containing protein [Gemmatimonadaceae bacterium]|nr:redoxin domain-containing protein [Gemmatimonadaceae bacterium]